MTRRTWVVFPALAVLLVVLAFNLLGRAGRDWTFAGDRVGQFALKFFTKTKKRALLAIDAKRQKAAAKYSKKGLEVRSLHVLSTTGAVTRCVC